ncbi:hypothetical protein KDX00_03150 [Cobetia amphilecti]|nr:hypothetical protein KDX00_03150 [Cobetia litoralis]
MNKYLSMNLEEIFHLIEKLPEGARRQQALAHALDELLEEEIEYRTGLRHQNAGWHQVSSVGGMGEGRGECTGLVDHVGKAAERYQRESQWRTMAAALLSRLTDRQRMAVLLAAYAIPPVQHCQSPRMMTQSQAVAAQAAILARLGWAPGAVEMAPFKSPTALRKTAARGRDSLLYMVLLQAEMAAWLPYVAKVAARGYDSANV